MVNFVNVDGLFGFRGLEDRTPAKARRRCSQKRPVFRVASSRFECCRFIILKTICSIFYCSVRPSVFGKTSPSPGLLDRYPAEKREELRLFAEATGKEHAALPSQNIKLGHRSGRPDLHEVSRQMAAKREQENYKTPPNAFSIYSSFSRLGKKIEEELGWIGNCFWELFGEARPLWCWGSFPFFEKSLATSQQRLKYPINIGYVTTLLVCLGRAVDSREGFKAWVEFVF